MKSALRTLAIVIAIVLSAPMILFALYGSLVSLLRMAFDGGLDLDLWTRVRWPVILLLWWLGLVGTLWLCILLSSREKSRGQRYGALAMFCVGLISVGMIEFEGNRAPALRFLPVGLETVPYLSLLALGAVWRMISNFRWSGP